MKVKNVVTNLHLMKTWHYISILNCIAKLFHKITITIKYKALLQEMLNSYNI